MWKTQEGTEIQKQLFSALDRYTENMEILDPEDQRRIADALTQLSRAHTTRNTQLEAIAIVDEYYRERGQRSEPTQPAEL
ncbi:MAG: hypothetical protein J4432_00875 [DPANN group archaeon]|nr:hypothetical protein [DPANN group archaeon]